MDCLSPIVIKVRDGPNNSSGRVTVPCGRCEACVRHYQATWLTRLRFETDSQYYSNFVTLTYNDENLPEGGNVSKDDVQKFHKRLRSALAAPERFKYYLVSEYGPDGFGHRPHYHAIYFGIPPLELHKIEECWNKGFVTIDKVTDGRLAYVTGYIIEKKCFVPEGREPVFNLISKGLGSSYLETHSDWHKQGGIIERSYVPYHGRKLPLPRYYKQKIFSDSQRRMYADMLSKEAAEREERYISEMGEEAYFRLVRSRENEFVRKVRNTHKKKKNNV